VTSPDILDRALELGVDIGGLLPVTDSNGGATWVPNISLHYVYF